MTYDTQLAPGTYLNTKIIKRVNVGGIEFDEKFLSELVANHLKDFKAKGRPKFSDAYSIYMAENPSAKRRKFKLNARQYFNEFTGQMGDLYLDELRHIHITQYRDYLLAPWVAPKQRSQTQQYFERDDQHGVQAPGHRQAESISELTDTRRRRKHSPDSKNHQ